MNKAISIEGKGNSSIVSGTLTVSTSYSSISKMRVTGNVSIGATYSHNNLSVLWVSSSSVVTNGGDKNYIVAIDD